MAAAAHVNTDAFPPESVAAAGARVDKPAAVPGADRDDVDQPDGSVMLAFRNAGRANRTTPVADQLAVNALSEKVRSGFDGMPNRHATEPFLVEPEEVRDVPAYLAGWVLLADVGQERASKPEVTEEPLGVAEAVYGRVPHG